MEEVKQQLSKNQQKIQRRRQLAIQILDRPPITTDWTTLPNVLVTHIAQSYLSQESESNRHGKHQHQREVIPFALTCRHWCRVLSASYRWYTPQRYYLVCDMKTMRLHVVNHEWRFDCDFDQIDCYSFASWPLPDGIEKNSATVADNAVAVADDATIIFPSSLTLLHLLQFPLSLVNIPLPSSLTDLTIGSMRHPIEDMILPQGLKRLHFEWLFDHPIEKLILPQQLESLTFGWCSST